MFDNLKKLHFCFTLTITKPFICLEKDKQVCLDDAFI